MQNLLFYVNCVILILSIAQANTERSVLMQPKRFVPGNARIVMSVVTAIFVAIFCKDPITVLLSVVTLNIGMNIAERI